METNLNGISPNFVIKAEEALLNHNPGLAMDICKQGIENFPDYTMGFILLAEAYEMAGDLESAKIIFNGANEIFFGNKTLQSIARQRLNTGKLRFFDIRPKVKEPEDIFLKFEKSITEKGFEKPRPEDLPEEIEDITEQNPEIPASEKLAEILTRQGKYSEAVEMYLKLISANPEKTDYFMSKIDSIKNLPEDGSNT